jgi:SAM-dependent methyltransferase
VRPIAAKPSERTYGEFARVYDAVMDDPVPKIARVVSYVERHHRGRGAILELGCGTGTILAGLGGLGALTGIDRSPEMLAIAREKVPGARLVEGDITSFDLGETFDVVVCIFDTLNHITTFGGWKELFARTRAHLTPGGLFIFDVNTTAKLRAIAGYPPWWSELPGADVIMKVDPPVDCISVWHVWIVERLPDGTLAGHHERIGELGVGLQQIEAALSEDFELLDLHDETGSEPDAWSERVHYAWRARQAKRSEWALPTRPGPVNAAGQ